MDVAKSKNENALERCDIYTMNNDIGGLELYGCFSDTAISRSNVRYIFRMNSSNVKVTRALLPE